MTRNHVTTPRPQRGDSRILSPGRDRPPSASTEKLSKDAASDTDSEMDSGASECGSDWVRLRKTYAGG